MTRNNNPPMRSCLTHCSATASSSAIDRGRRPFMGEFSKWLLHEDQKELFDYLFAVALNAVFLALVALLLWPAGRAATALSLAKGFWGFWTVIILITSLILMLQGLFRVDMYSHSDAYI